MEAPAPAPVVEAPSIASDDAMTFGDSADDAKEEDDTLSYFAKLARE